MPSPRAAAAGAAGRVSLTSSSPTHLRVNDGERKVLTAAPLALSSAWIAAVIDTVNRVSIRGFVADVWPDSDDDLDVEPDVALRRRWYLAATSVWPVAHPRVAAVCLAGEQGAVYAVSGKSIATIDVAVSQLPLSQVRVLPLAMPTVTVHPIVSDLESTFKTITKGRGCVVVRHENGVVNFDPATLTLKVPAREHRQRLRFACTDPPSIVDAANRFVDVMTKRKRDTVHALPQPFAHPSIAGFSTELVHHAIDTMRDVGSWVDAPGVDNDIAARRSDDALLLLDRTDDGRPIQAEVRLRAGKRSTTVHLQILDDTCSLSRVPAPWLALRPEPGERVYTDEVSSWRHAGSAWVAGPARAVVNARTSKAPTEQ